MSQAGIATGGGGGGSNIQTITGDSGGPVGPDAAHNINLEALYTNTVVGTPLTNTLTITPTVRGYPITPFVVGPATFAGYQTVQSAVNAANIAGGGTVWVQPGTYTENLTLFDKVTICGSVSQTDTALIKIIGTHTPPLSGQTGFFNIWLESPSAIYSSNAAGTAEIQGFSVIYNVTNGFTFDLPNWTGQINLFDIFSNGTDDGFINNTGGSNVVIFGSGFGNGSLNTMLISGAFNQWEAVQISCPVNFVTGSNFLIDNAQFFSPVTFSNNSTGYIDTGHFISGSSPAITMSSSAAISITNSTINSSNNPAVDGAGAGILTYAGIVFLDNTTFAGTLTLQPANWRPYSTAGTAINAVRGTSGFDTARFTVTNGFVTLNGAGFTWVDQGVSTTLLLNTGYYVTAASTQTLPAAPQQGDTVKIICDTASAVVVTANAGQTIRLSASASSVAGTFTNTARGDSLDLFYRAATTQWIALNAVGNWTVA